MLCNHTLRCVNKVVLEISSLDRIAVSTVASHATDPGSIPGPSKYFVYYIFISIVVIWTFKVQYFIMMVQIYLNSKSQFVSIYIITTSISLNIDLQEYINALCILINVLCHSSS